MLRRALGDWALAFVLARLLLCCLAVLAAPAKLLAQNGDLGNAVKATYLYKFAPFVEWPPSAFASSTDPVTLCIVGDDPFGALLDRAVAGQRVGERPILVRRFHIADPHAFCHILFAAGSPGQPVAEIVALMRGKPVLIVTDAQRDVRAKGTINFVVDDNRVRFEIDNQIAAEGGLAISSKLLSLAIAVRPRA
jgi:hypothetical protein